jgi:hypothetical protein
VFTFEHLGFIRRGFNVTIKFWGDKSGDFQCSPLLCFGKIKTTPTLLFEKLCKIFDHNMLNCETHQTLRTIPAKKVTKNNVQKQV